MSTSAENEIVQEPSMAKNAIEGSENWRSTPGQTGGARTMTKKEEKNPSSPP